MGYTKKAVQGVSVGTLLKVADTGVKAVKLFALARLLTPADFGLFSLVAITLGIIESLTETGINTTIVQSEKSVHYFLDTAWVIAILRGFIIGVIMVFMGIGMTQWYHESQLLFYISLAAFVPCIKGFINPAIVSLQKNLHFVRDGMYRFSLLVVDASVAIVAGFLFHSVLAFLAGMIASAIFEVVISFLFFRTRPRFSYVKSRAHDIFTQAKSLNLTAMMTYLIQNVDNLLIGKILGTELLGIYANSYALSHKLNAELAKSVIHGTFPVFSRIHTDLARLRRAFWKATISSTFFFVAISLPLIFFPKLVVEIVLGSQWNQVIPILPALTIAGVMQSWMILASALFLARAQYRWLNVSLAVNTISLIGLLLFLTPQYGINGGVTAVVVSRILMLPIISYGIWRTLKSHHSPSQSLS